MSVGPIVQQGNLAFFIYWIFWLGYFTTGYFVLQYFLPILIYTDVIVFIILKPLVFFRPYKANIVFHINIILYGLLVNGKIVYLLTIKIVLVLSSTFMLLLYILFDIIMSHPNNNCRLINLMPISGKYYPLIYSHTILCSSF